MWVETRCHLCGSDLYDVVHDNLKKPVDTGEKLLYKITDHSLASSVRVVCCRQCGFTYLNPRSDQNLYVDSYVSMIDDKYLEEEEGRRASARRILKYLNKSKGTLLDIGCAAGFFLDEARKAGWDVYGVDLSEWAVKHAREKLGLKNVHQELLRQVKFPASFFDVVVMTDVIEHLIDPKSTLEEIRPLLKPNGIICCTTPDIDSLMSRLQGSRWWYIKPSHLYYFNKLTLSELFNSAGFTVVKTRSHARTFSLGYWTANMVVYKPAFKFIDIFLKKHPKLAALSITFDLGDQIEIFVRKRTADQIAL